MRSGVLYYDTRSYVPLHCTLGSKILCLERGKYRYYFAQGRPGLRLQCNTCILKSITIVMLCIVYTYRRIVL